MSKTTTDTNKMDDPMIHDDIIRLAALKEKLELNLIETLEMDNHLWTEEDMAQDIISSLSTNSSLTALKVTMGGEATRMMMMMMKESNQVGILSYLCKAGYRYRSLTLTSLPFQPELVPTMLWQMRCLVQLVVDSPVISILASVPIYWESFANALQGHPCLEVVSLHQHCCLSSSTTTSPMSEKVHSPMLREDKAVFRSITSMPRLKVFEYIGENGPGMEGVGALGLRLGDILLLAQTCPNIEKIVYSGIGFRQPTCIPYKKENSTLSHLDLSNNRLDDQTIIQLVYALKLLTNITSLDVRQNPIGTMGEIALKSLEDLPCFESLMYSTSSSSSPLLHPDDKDVDELAGSCSSSGSPVTVMTVDSPLRKDFTSTMSDKVSEEESFMHDDILLQCKRLCHHYF